MKKVGIARLPLANKDKPGPSTRIGTLDIIIFVILLIYALAIIFPF